MVSSTELRRQPHHDQLVVRALHPRRDQHLHARPAARHPALPRLGVSRVPCTPRTGEAGVEPRRDCSLEGPREAEYLTGYLAVRPRSIVSRRSSRSARSSKRRSISRLPGVFCLGGPASCRCEARATNVEVIAAVTIATKRDPLEHHERGDDPSGDGLRRDVAVADGRHRLDRPPHPDEDVRVLLVVEQPHQQAARRRRSPPSS